MRPKQKPSETIARRRPPAVSPDAREKQLIGLAVDLAEKQLAEGTASSQVIVHYLRLGSMREKLEREKLEQENKLLRAKKEALESARRVEELYSEAIAAFKSYLPTGEDDDTEV